jgi:hypothetical protein
MDRLIIFILILSFIFATITYLLHKYFKHKAVVKYIPSVIAAVSGISFFIKSRFFSQGFEDLAYMILTIIAGVVFVVAFIIAIVMEFSVKRKRSN